MDREALTAVRDALKAVQRAEAFLEQYRPTLAQLGPLVATMGELVQDHSRVALDLRINRLRLQAMLPPEPAPADEHDRPTPVDGSHRRSQQMAAVRPKEPPDEPEKG